MDKNKAKYLGLILVLLLAISGGYNIYQYKRIKSVNEELNFVIYNSLQKFASKGGNVENEISWNEQFASIVSASDAYITLSGDKGVPQEEWEYNLSALLLSIKETMYNDIPKFKDVFQRREVSELMFKIAANPEDRESINEVYRLLN